MTCCNGNCDQGRQCPARPPYDGPERRIPLDSPALRRVVLWLLVFWLSVGVLAPLVAHFVGGASWS